MKQNLRKAILTGNEGDGRRYYTSIDFSPATHLPVQRFRSAMLFTEIRLPTSPPVPTRSAVQSTHDQIPSLRDHGMSCTCTIIDCQPSCAACGTVCPWTVGTICSGRRRCRQASCREISMEQMHSATLEVEAQRWWNRVCHGTIPFSREVISSHLIARC